ncbi:hypothetical protein WG66_007322 [Moniliophthora roreri]|nr:hypothetical protein WG66_007322 [Moniliophthora roreri]
MKSIGVPGLKAWTMEGRQAGRQKQSDAAAFSGKTTLRKQLFKLRTSAMSDDFVTHLARRAPIPKTAERQKKIIAQHQYSYYKTSPAIIPLFLPNPHHRALHAMLPPSLPPSQSIVHSAQKRHALCS